MNIYKVLNEVISYLESNLKNQIDYHKVAKLLGTNLYTAEQLFKLLTGITMKEYVRFRRLTLAAKDLRDNQKVIDVANMYGYSNHASFTRSFSAFHHVPPKEVKFGHSSNVFPIIHFNDTICDLQNMKYKIIHKKKFLLYTRKERFQINKSSDLIEEFWKKAKEENLCFNTEERRYGVSEHILNNDRDFYYHIGLEFPWSKSSQIIISSAKWFVITVTSFKALDIHNFINKAEQTYLPSLNYKLESKNYIEIYFKDNVELWFPLT